MLKNKRCGSDFFKVHVGKRNVIQLLPACVCPSAIQQLWLSCSIFVNLIHSTFNTTALVPTLCEGESHYVLPQCVHPLWDSLVRRRAKSAIYRAAGFEREKNGFCSERQREQTPPTSSPLPQGKRRATGHGFRNVE